MPCLKPTYLIILALILPACGTNPVTGKTEFQFVSESEEIKIGNEHYLSTRQSQGGKYIIDPDLSKYVNSVGQKIAKVSDRPNLPYEFVVLNNSVPNAWALPGGKIAFNRGLLVELKNEAEMAAVIAHEIVHAAARHGAKGMERGMLLSAGILGLGIAADDQDNAELIVGAAALGGSLINQKYGRDAELESDKFGMKYMVRAGYDPFAAVELQKTFVRLSKGKQSNWLEGLFASHPPSQDRVKANEKTAKKLSKKLKGKGVLNAEIYQKRIAHIMKTIPAYEAHQKAQKAFKNKDTNKAQSLINEAIKIEPKEAMFYSFKGDLSYHKKDYKKAEQFYSEAVNNNPAFFMFYLQRGLTKEKLNKLDESQRDLEKSVKLLPTAPAYNTLGNIALKKKDSKKAKQYFKQAAGSKSTAGKQAAASYAKLDFPSNPNKYFDFETFKAGNNRLGIKIINRSPMAANQIKGSVQIYNSKGKLIAKDTISFANTIAAGKSANITTRISIINIEKDSSLQIKISQATPVSG